MAGVFFDNPPNLLGDEKSQLVQLQRYLGTLSEKLNVALMDISIEQMAPETRTVVEGAVQNAEKNYDTLKSMIIKTAEIVRSEMQEISTTLEGQYVAISNQFGTYEANLTNTITATAEGILQDYRFEERIEGVEGGQTETGAVLNRIQSYIFTGKISDNPVKYGIAIGENVTNADGTLNTNNRMATFTVDELAFWQGETKVGYFSDRVFHIANGEITESLTMGNHNWKIMTGGAMGLISG